MLHTSLCGRLRAGLDTLGKAIQNLQREDRNCRLVVSVPVLPRSGGVVPSSRNNLLYLFFCSLAQHTEFAVSNFAVFDLRFLR